MRPVKPSIHFVVHPLVRALSGVALCVAMPLSAHAARDNVFWKGTVSQSWDIPGNWEIQTGGAHAPTLSPGDQDPVFIQTSTGPVMVTGAAKAWYLGMAPEVGDVASLTVTGAAASLDVSSEPYVSAISVGVLGHARAQVEKGATVKTLQFSIGNGRTDDSTPAGSGGSATITDAGSSLAAGILSVGGITPGVMDVKAGAQVTSDSVLIIGGFSGSTANQAGTSLLQLDGSGVMTVDGAGTRLVAGDTIVGLQGKGVLTVSGGASATFAPTPPASQTPLGIYAGSGLNIGGFSFNLNGANNMTMPFNADGTMNVTGTGTSVTVTGDVLMALFGAAEIDPTLSGTDLPTNAVLSVADGATMTVAGRVLMGRNVVVPNSPANTVEINVGTGGASGTLQADFIGSNTALGFVNFNHTDDITFSPLIRGLATVKQMNSGATTLAQGHDYDGATLVSAGRLVAGAADAFSFRSAHTVSGGGMLDADGFDQTLLSLVNGGIVNLPNTAALPKSGARGKSIQKAAPGQPGVVMTVAGNYTSNDGMLVLGTALGSDAAPTDKLVVQGDSVLGSGPTRIDVHNINGAGAATTGNGIEVVSVVGASAPNAFVLTSAPRAGNFLYSLAQVGNNWYLQSKNVPLQAQTITFGAQPPQKFTQGGTFALPSPATASSGLPVSYASTTPAVCTISGATVTMLSLGSCGITASQAGDSIWSPATAVPQVIALQTDSNVTQPTGPGASAVPVPVWGLPAWLLGTGLLGGLGGVLARRKRAVSAKGGSESQR
ncbi:hypothetical protein [Diaphorobacter caeni]|uniref:hypothetical protein n=1 Tax=Diaphorobacter caeni TaxID=2784387 RepID=UPI0018900BE4|nr:hypothetical protein [Diaphorobacter caeni]MBF5004074.1 hypothetical protein [Diaphorobacter caeni]